MGIDRIGKGAPPPIPDAGGAGGAGGIEKKGSAERTFQVERTGSKQAEGASSATGVEGAKAEPLARLRAGEIDLDGYMDLKVDEATKGLDGLSANQMAEIKRVLKDQMASDPGLSDLVRTATGQFPKPPED